MYISEYFMDLEEDINTLLWIWINKVELIMDWDNGNFVRITLSDYSKYWYWLCEYVFLLLNNWKIENYSHTITDFDIENYKLFLLRNKNNN